MPPKPVETLAGVLHRNAPRLRCEEVGPDNPLVAEGILYPCGHQDTFPCDCGVCESPAVYSTGNGYAYRCQSTGCSVPLSSEEITLMGVDGNKLATRLSTLLEGDTPRQTIPNRLWDLGTSRLNIGRWKRRVYFARDLNADAASVLTVLPADATLLLIVGSSHPFQVDAELAKRVFRLQDVASVDSAGTWTLNKAAMDNRFMAAPKQKAKPSRPSRAEEAKKIDATLQGLAKRLRVFNRSGKMRERDKLMTEITVRLVAEQSGVKYDTARRIIESWLPAEKRAYKSVAVLWDICRDVERLQETCW